MSVADIFLNAGKQFLLASENLKRLDERLNRLSDDVAAINVRLVRVETIISMDNHPQPRTRRPRTLPGDTR